MVILLLLLGLIALAAGLSGAAFGIPLRETTFGAAMLVAGSVGVTGGFILIGLAAAVSEMRRALAHLRQAERRDGAGAGRRTEPRIDRPAGRGPDIAHVIPTRFDAPDPEAAEPRGTPAAGPERFDTIRPADYLKPETGASGPPPPASSARADEMKSPPLPPAETAAAAAIKPSPRVLKSGTINDVDFTLFSDGSIETPTPEGTLHFDSIEEFRQHLERSAG